MREAAEAIDRIGRITGDVFLIAEAELLLQVVRDLNPLRLGVSGRLQSALSADPKDPEVLVLIGDTTIVPAARWRLIESVLPAFCLNPREVLFGIDPRRSEVLQRARSLVRDIERSDEWIDLNLKMLERWSSEPYDSTPIGFERFLQFVGLWPLWTRIESCVG